MDKQTTAILLISLGTIFLLNNFGIIPWIIWPRLVLCWPLLLVLVGIRLVLGRSNLAKNITLVVILAAIILSIIMVFKTPKNIPPLKRIRPNNPGEIYEFDPFGKRPYQILIK